MKCFLREIHQSQLESPDKETVKLNFDLFFVIRLIKLLD